MARDAYRLTSLLGVVALVPLATGCGSDSSGEKTASVAVTGVSVPAVTSPVPGTTSSATTTRAGKKKGQTTTATSGGSGSCAVPDAFTDFKYTGIDCSAAVAVATAWDQNGKTCNNVDNPDSPIGPRRTCSVEGFSCTSKHDYYSDKRFVTCTQGGQSVRFTWLPA